MPSIPSIPSFNRMFTFSNKHAAPDPPANDPELQAAVDADKAAKAAREAPAPAPAPAPAGNKTAPHKFAESRNIDGNMHLPIRSVNNPTLDPRFKNAQASLLAQLQDRAAGRGGPSLAAMQQKQAGNKAMQNTLGAVRAGTGSNAALAARTAALAGGNQMANLANESAILRMREQQDAQNAIAGVAAQGRQSEMGEAGLSIDTQRLNQASDLAQRGLMNEQDRAVLAAQTALATSAIDAAGRVNAAEAGKPEAPKWWENLIAPLVTSGISAIVKTPGEKALAKSTTGPTAPLPYGPQPGTNGDQIINTPQQAPAPQGPQAGPYEDSSQNTMSLVRPTPVPVPKPAPKLAPAPMPRPVPKPVPKPIPVTPTAIQGAPRMMQR